MTPERAPSRLVALDGAVNVRDIGGYRSVARARGHPRAAVPRRFAQPAHPRGYRPARSARAAHRHRLQDPGRGPARRPGPAPRRDRTRAPARQRRRPRVGLRAHNQRRPRTAARQTRRRAGRLVHGPAEPHVRDRHAAATGVRRRAAAHLRVRPAAAALPLHERQGPIRLDDRHRADRPGRATRTRAARLPAVQRPAPHRLHQAPVRPGQDRDRTGPRAAAAHSRAKRHLPGRGVRGGGPQVRVVQHVPDPRA